MKAELQEGTLISRMVIGDRKIDNTTAVLHKATTIPGQGFYFKKDEDSYLQFKLTYWESLRLYPIPPTFKLADKVIMWAADGDEKHLFTGVVKHFSILYPGREKKQNVYTPVNLRVILSKNKAKLTDFRVVLDQVTVYDPVLDHQKWFEKQVEVAKFWAQAK